MTLMTALMKPGDSSNDKVSPIYKALSRFQDIGAAYTGRGISPRNIHFSFRTPPVSDPSPARGDFAANLKHLAHREGFDSRNLLWPKGGWPHTGQVIKAEDYAWVADARLGGLTSVPREDGRPVMYDGVVTRSTSYVLGVQGADCPMVFLYDPIARVVGLVHAGWKPVVRGVVGNAVEAMTQLGARPKDVVAYVAPGVGDRYNEFQWDGRMESHVRLVFVEAGRMDLLDDESIRHKMTQEEQAQLTLTLGRKVHGGISLRLTSLILTELERYGLLAGNVSYNSDSTILSQYSCTEENELVPCKYHSYRREFPDHGLSIGILFLKPEPSESMDCGGEICDSGDS